MCLGGIGILLFAPATLYLVLFCFENELQFASVEEVDSLFKRMFPKLLIEVYSAIDAHCSDDEKNNSFKDYFDMERKSAASEGILV